jgi:hypothetical protein
MPYNETPTKGLIMIKKIKNLEPNTKMTIKAVAIHAAIMGGIIVATKMLEKKNSEN